MKVVSIEEYKKRKMDSIFEQVKKDLEDGREPFDINAELERIRSSYEKSKEQ